MKNFVLHDAATEWIGGTVLTPHHELCHKSVWQFIPSMAVGQVFHQSLLHMVSELLWQTSLFSFPRRTNTNHN